MNTFQVVQLIKIDDRHCAHLLRKVSFIKITIYFIYILSLLHSNNDGSFILFDFFHLPSLYCTRGHCQIQKIFQVKTKQI